MLTIGSLALLWHGVNTEPVDIDLIATFDELNEFTSSMSHEHFLSIPLSHNKTLLRCQCCRSKHHRPIEVEIAWPDSSGADLLNSSYTAARMHPGAQGKIYYDKVATLDVLYTLKMSHRFKKNSPHFIKTRNDIILLRNMGAKIWNEEWLEKREAETYSYGHPKLNVKKSAFFMGDGIEYVYDHDSIHLAMAHLDPELRIRRSGIPVDRIPAYMLYMKDGAEVQASKQKFFAAHSDVRLYGVLEEAQVLALERSQIPHRAKSPSAHKSFTTALIKVCTSITSGWFREFAWENFHAVMNMYEPDYVDRFWRAVDAGIVKPFKSAG